jgi:hypothetical protein
LETVQVRPNCAASVEVQDPTQYWIVRYLDEKGTADWRLVETLKHDQIGV